MKFVMLTLSVALVAAAAAPSLCAQETVDGFVARKYTNSAGATLPYRLFIPRGYDKGRTYPLVVFLHGGWGRGSDNLKQLSEGNAVGPHVWTREATQSKNPAFVVVPQTPEGETWGGPENSELSPSARLMLEIVEGLLREFSIDRARLYLTGQSLGGYGTWDIIVRRPDMFAAAVPLCGSGRLDRAPYRTTYSPSELKKIVDMPMWVFQGAEDENVPVAGVRETVAALRKLGSKVKYTEYAGVGHAVWEKAYEDPELIDWMFAQRRPH